MNRYIIFLLALACVVVLGLIAFPAHAATLVSETPLPNGKLVCVYSDGTSVVTSFNQCPSFRR